MTKQEKQNIFMRYIDNIEYIGEGKNISMPKHTIRQLNVNKLKELYDVDYIEFDIINTEK